MIIFQYLTSGIILNQVSLYTLLAKPKLQSVYRLLLKQTFIEGNNCICINLEHFKKKTGYKTRSGVWKSLKKLEKLKLITVERNVIQVHGMVIGYR